MGDLLRFAQPGITACIVGIVIILVIMPIINAISRKTSASIEDAKYAAKWIMWISIIVIAILFVACIAQLIGAALVNSVSRSIIDYSGIDFSKYATPTPLN